MASIGFTPITQDCYGHCCVSYPDFLIAPHASAAAAAAAPATPCAAGSAAPAPSVESPGIDRRMLVQARVPITRLPEAIFIAIAKFLSGYDISRLSPVSVLMATRMGNDKIWKDKVISLSIPPHLDIVGIAKQRFSHAYAILRATSRRLEMLQPRPHSLHLLHRMLARTLPWLTEEEHKELYGKIESNMPLFSRWIREMSTLSVIPESREALHDTANEYMLSNSSLIETLANMGGKAAFKAKGNVCLMLIGDLAVRKNPKRNATGQAEVATFIHDELDIFLIPEEELLPARVMQLRNIACTNMQVTLEELDVMLEKTETIFTCNLFTWYQYLITVDYFQMDGPLDGPENTPSMSRFEYAEVLKRRLESWPAATQTMSPEEYEKVLKDSLFEVD